MMVFFQAHKTEILSFVSAVFIAGYDFMMKMNPNWKADGIAHWVYLQVGGKDTPVEPPKS